MAERTLPFTEISNFFLSLYLKFLQCAFNGVRILTLKMFNIPIVLQSLSSHLYFLLEIYLMNHLHINIVKSSHQIAIMKTIKVKN